MDNYWPESMPPYFSWILDKILAVSAFPYHHSHLRYLISNGIHTIVSMTPEKEPPFHTKPEIEIIHFHVPENGAPNLDQCCNFVRLMEEAKLKRKGVLVHDMNGKSGSAVLLACYLINLWECPADYIIDHLRLIRPISIESLEQEDVVYNYHAKVSNNFKGRYSKIQEPSGWNINTNHLGKDYDSLMTTGYDIRNTRHLCGDTCTNQSTIEKLEKTA